MNYQTITIQSDLTSRKAETIRRELKAANPSRDIEIERHGDTFDKNGFAVVEYIRTAR